MRNLVVIACFLIFGLTQAQDVKPTFKQVGEDGLIKATYFYKNGEVKEQGFFKDKKLTGVWTSYNNEGVKVRVARYKNGKKVGKWLFWTNEGLKEVSYKNNVIVSVKTSFNESRLASK